MHMCRFLLLMLLVIEGWTLKGQGETDYITAFSGESVLLPCSCTDLHSTPDTFSWEKYNTNRNRWEEISSESDQYRNRVQLFNHLSPANLSLLISHLTEEDAGPYRCNLKMIKYRYYYIIVKDPPHTLPFVPFALATVIFLHIIVAVVYCTKRTRATSVSDSATIHFSNVNEVMKMEE